MLTGLGDEPTPLDLPVFKDNLLSLVVDVFTKVMNDVVLGF